MNASRMFVASLFLWLTGLYAVAQDTADTGKDATDFPAKGWYGGIGGGVPFGVSSLSSFGADKTRAGYAFGLFGGYRFNPVLSAELSAKWGKVNLSARNCCAESGYWLGTDRVTYHAPVAGFGGADYADLKSSVLSQQYGVQLNVNLLGFFRKTKQSCWRLELSPKLAAVGTKVDVKTIAAGNSLIKDKMRWHLGAGGNLQASYAITRHLHLGVYSGIVYLTGKGMDGVAERIHDANFLWESGVRLCLSFGKCRMKVQPAAVPVPIIQEPPVAEVKPPVQQEPEPTPVADKKEERPVADTQEESITFPVIYFDFNKSDIKTGEMSKLQDIFETLCAHPDMKINITGWTDRAGGISVNKRLSIRRAEAVKAWLLGQGIDATRMEVQGMGIDHEEPDAAKARRVVVADAERKEVQP